MNYKIIATDLDGTLLNSQMELSQENNAAIQAYASMGGHFVASTGRSFSEICEAVKEHPAIRYFITSNGGAVFDRERKECMVRCGIIGAEKEFLLRTLRRYQSIFTIHFDGVSYADQDCRDHDLYRSYRMHEFFIRHIEERDDYIGNFQTFCDGMDHIESCCCFFRTEQDLEACRAELLAHGGFSVTASMPHNLEINSARSGKGVALLALAEKLGVDPQKTIGVGDSTNDADNLRRAGLGLAVQNAHPDLLKIADRVICSNDEHIAKYILENIIMK